MKFGTIGAGTVALAFARYALAAGHEVALSSQGGPDTLGAKVAALGQGASAATVGDAIAREPVKVLNFPPDRMRALLIGEAELGERLMRALIRADLVRNATAHPDPAKARPATGPRFRETLAGSARHLS
jgi:3-hydroxyisobutyrate dehydrogenase-like beta-hydroxyacid dehydrogenase